MHPIGVTEFDEAFHVNGTPRALAVELHDAPTRRPIQNANEGFALRQTDLAITREGAPSDVEPLVAMVRYAMEIVERCADLARAPRALAAALDLALEERSTRSDNGDLRVAMGVVRTRPVTLALRVDDERALTILSFVDHGQQDWTLERGAADRGRTPDRAGPWPISPRLTATRSCSPHEFHGVARGTRIAHGSRTRNEPLQGVLHDSHLDSRARCSGPHAHARRRLR